MDGWVTIGTKLDTSQLERDYAKLQKELERKQKESEKLLETKAKVEKDMSAYEEEKREYERLVAVADEYKNKLEQLNEQKKAMAEKGQIRASDLANRDNILAQIRQAESEWAVASKEVQDYNAKLDKSTRKYEEQRQKLEQINSKLEDNKLSQQGIVEKIDETTMALEKSRQRDTLQGIADSVGNIQGKMGGVLKSVAHWGLALLSIRGAYSLVRQASSTLGQYDKEYSANLEYIRFVLAQAIAPILKGIVQLVYQILNGINAIVQAWFGINIFANASKEAFAKAKRGAMGVSGALGDAVDNAKELNKQVAGFDEMNILSENTKQSTSSGAGGGSGIDMPSIDFGQNQEPPKWMKWIRDHKNEILDALIGIATALTLIKFGVSGIQALGIGLAISSILYTIQSIKEYLESPTWENFGKILQGVGGAIIGVALLIGNLPLAIAGACILIIGTIVKYWDDIKVFFQNGIDWLKGKSDWVHEMVGDFLGNIYDAIVDTLQWILDVFDGFFKVIKGIFDAIIEFVKGVFTGDWETAWTNIKNAFGEVWDGIKEIGESTFNWILKFIDDVVSAFESLREQIVTFVINGIASAFEGLINMVVGGINSIISGINGIPGIEIGYIPDAQLPRMATGGIINMPNRGVNIGGAIAGESGAEGVIPLTDMQAMETLGEAIGRYVTLNANIVNTIDGRTLSRHMERITAKNQFAYNS